jgi:hypothetical protein
MASTIKVDKIEGSTGSTITVPTGQTLTLTDGLGVSSLPTVTVAKGGTNLTSFTAGDVLYATGATTLAKLAKGSDDEVLTLASGVPSWAASAGGGKLLQAVYSTWSGVNTTTSTSYENVHNDATVVITPTSATSRIVVLIGIGMFYSSTTGSNAIISMRREVTSDASDLYGDVHATFGIMHTWGPNTIAGGFFYDDLLTNNPGLVSLTYRVRYRTQGPGTTTLGRSGDLNSLLALEIEA